MGGSSIVSRNAIISTITGDEAVSKGNHDVLTVFTLAKQEYLSDKKVNEQKGSLLKFDKWNIADKLYMGFAIYSLARERLATHFGIDPNKPEPELSSALKPFYKEVRRLNRGSIWELRFLSLFSSLRSSTGIVNPANIGINLGALPGYIIVAYKIIVFVVSAFVFSSIIAWFFMIIISRAKVNRDVVIFSLIYGGFLFINFILAIGSDSNRYKYPAEPIIILLAIWFVNEWNQIVVIQKRLIANTS
jgi:hypothetical protein